MKKFKDMDRYEQAIACELHKNYPEFYTEESAKKTLENYCEWSERLHKQVQKGISPEQWMNDTIKIEQIPNYPKTKEEK